MIITLKSALRRNDIKEFESILKNMDSVPYLIQDEIIINKKEVFLHLLIKYDKLSSGVNSLSGMFDTKSRLAITIKNKI